jgi:hypothetical protein
MIIIKISSGLGNQLFQYALYLNFKMKNKDCKFDTSFFKSNFNEGRALELNHIFNIVIDEATNEEVVSYKHKSKIINFLFNKNYIKKVGLDSYKYFNEILYQSDCYLDGYWQNIGYLENIYSDLKKNLVFSEKFDNLRGINLDYYKAINQSNSVSIHIRRGDYFGHKLLGDVVTLDYYNNSIDYMNIKITNPHYFIFSDDIKWCEENLKVKNCTYINSNSINSHHYDFYLMSRCKNNIIANSSFSWWAAWLNPNPNKIVITPKKWIKPNVNYINFLPNEWIGL